MEYHEEVSTFSSDRRDVASITVGDDASVASRLRFGVLTCLKYYYYFLFFFFFDVILYRKSAYVGNDQGWE
jgi:hypothetical protein